MEGVTANLQTWKSLLNDRRTISNGSQSEYSFSVEMFAAWLMYDAFSGVFESSSVRDVDVKNRIANCIILLVNFLIVHFYVFIAKLL